MKQATPSSPAMRAWVLPGAASPYRTPGAKHIERLHPELRPDEYRRWSNEQPPKWLTGAADRYVSRTLQNKNRRYSRCAEKRNVTAGVIGGNANGDAKFVAALLG
jgi:hypothetical protein